ncbi:DNA-binding NarL/FixJ family response regulator [Flavobacterium arsenatis]|uniref:DNA-binding NarL/FixJ family response regulator n=1 Tax=Flavobacterium arsenatis TaxID=1484332 RepID=A0ABU1TLK6_9FLAO|nr:response regulator transcription factor [Flavobacterium arsenatis]MDR6966702.1 DNA-binding NarL/FixJ family response regulator [Flavobacterium arsenatis]
MKLVLADDHFLVLDGLELLLSTFDFVEKTAGASDYPSLKEVLGQDEYDVLLLDIHFGKFDGREIILEIKKKYPEIKVIALTSYSDMATIKSAVNVGFDGYLLKTDSRVEIEKALKAVFKGEKYFSSQTQQTFFETQTLKPNVELTQREKDILQHIVEEKTTKEIAEHLFISEKTVETHRGNLMLKLEARNIAGVVRKAIMLGLVEI